METCTPIAIGGIELGTEITLWDIMHATLDAKEARPGASVLPTILVLKSQEIVAKICQSREEPRVLLIRTMAGIHKISMNWYDVLQMLYRVSFMTLQKMEGSAVIFFGERMDDAGHATLYAMKWTARQFLQQPPRGANFPETNDSILQAFYLEDDKVRWMPEVTTALQFSL
jgi:hypothetical protein